LNKRTFKNKRSNNRRPPGQNVNSRTLQKTLSSLLLTQTAERGRKLQSMFSEAFHASGEGRRWNGVCGQWGGGWTSIRGGGAWEQWRWRPINGGNEWRGKRAGTQWV